MEISDIVKLFKGVIQSQFRTFSGQLKAEQSESISKKLEEKSLAFPGISSSFQSFPALFNSSNSSHFSTARAETSSKGGSLCCITPVSTALQQGTGSPTAQRERPHKVNDKYTGCSNCVEGKSKMECSVKHTCSLKRHCKKWEEIGAFQYILKVIYSGNEIPFVLFHRLCLFETINLQQTTLTL